MRSPRYFRGFPCQWRRRVRKVRNPSRRARSATGLLRCAYVRLAIGGEGHLQRVAGAILSRVAIEHLDQPAAVLVAAGRPRLAAWTDAPAGASQRRDGARRAGPPVRAARARPLRPGATCSSGCLCSDDVHGPCRGTGPDHRGQFPDRRGGRWGHGDHAEACRSSAPSRDRSPSTLKRTISSDAR